jgi:phosphoribosylanthranilate isomerase
VEIIKAFRVRSAETLELLQQYVGFVDTLLLDAYDPNLLGGTGHTIDWSLLQGFRSDCPWLLAGGLTPENISNALERLAPDGIDLSSGVEIAPGNKDLRKVEQLFEALRQFHGAIEVDAVG